MISTENTIESEFIKTVTELVEYYAGKRPAVDRCKTDPTGETVAGIIGFADQATRGSILLICSEFVLSNFANQHQSANTEQPGKLSMDLLGELSNQVAGRLKNRLIKYGITLKIALPMVLPGRQIEAGCIGMCKRMYRVTWPQEELHAMLCFDVESGIKLQSKGENKVATEGTIELF
jgi:CheY-specific phosphatase CheX